MTAPLARGEGLDAALSTRAFEVAALRLLVGLTRALETTAATAPETREQLLSLLGGAGEARR